METYAINHDKKIILFYQEHNPPQASYGMNLTDSQYESMMQYINK